MVPAEKLRKFRRWGAVYCPRRRQRKRRDSPTEGEALTSESPQFEGIAMDVVVTPRLPPLTVDQVDCQRRGDAHISTNADFEWSV